MMVLNRIGLGTDVATAVVVEDIIVVVVVVVVAMGIIIRRDRIHWSVFVHVFHRLAKAIGSVEVSFLAEPNDTKIVLGRIQTERIFVATAISELLLPPKIGG